jgi:hypothetical protein
VRVSPTSSTDLAAAVEYAKQHAGEPARSGALYGMAGSPTGNEQLGWLLSGALDAMYAVPTPSTSAAEEG